MFCKAEVAKNRVTQHLKTCKQRLAAIAQQEEQSTDTKTRLFHIIAEGRYDPEYWLHLEIPATESLWTLDQFLKDMWIEDLDHLSGFEINGTTYSDEYPDEYFTFEEVNKVEEEEEEISEEDREKEIKAFTDKTLKDFTEESPSYPGIPFGADAIAAEWITEIKKPRSEDELINFLKVELARLTKEARSSRREFRDVSSSEANRKRYHTLHLQEIIVEDILEAIEDRSMEVLLKRVLKVGQKFSYIYDYGSSTHVNLKVVGEREGTIQNKKKPVQLLARNIAPAFICADCKKPATRIAIGYFEEDIASTTFCTKCSKKHDDDGGMMPIINSPRLGVL